MSPYGWNSMPVRGGAPAAVSVSGGMRAMGGRGEGMHQVPPKTPEQRKALALAHREALKSEAPLRIVRCGVAQCSSVLSCTANRLPKGILPCTRLALTGEEEFRPEVEGFLASEAARIVRFAKLCSPPVCPCRGKPWGAVPVVDHSVVRLGGGQAKAKSKGRSQLSTTAAEEVARDPLCFSIAALAAEWARRLGP